MEELDLEPSVHELEKAIDCVATGKAPGRDIILPEVIKCGKPALLQLMYKLLCLCWPEKSVPQDMSDTNTISLFENKGDRGECNNFRGISLLVIVGKVYARVVLGRLHILAAKSFNVGLDLEDQVSTWSLPSVSSRKNSGSNADHFS